jgi:hypothetical protein
MQYHCLDAMDRQRIRAKIREMAASPKNVRFDDVENLLDNHIGPLFPNYSHHHGSTHHAFTVGRQTFNIAKPHAGGVKKPYIMKFLDAMEMVDLYEP